MLIAALGEPSPAKREAWASVWPDARWVALRHPASSGRRAGSRAMGVGVDSLRTALKVHGRQRVLATNPWVGMACRYTGSLSLAITGIYATPGRRAWNWLGDGLGRTPVVATSEIERDAWRDGGGRAESVLWGDTFDLPEPAPRGEPCRVFVGGTSDRDAEAVAKIAAEAQAGAPLELVIADGSSDRQGGPVRWHDFLPMQRFLAEMMASDVVWLPLMDRRRAAGHMVLVAALQAGKPVLVTPTAAMGEYVETAGDAVRTEPPSVDVLLELAAANLHGEARTAWETSFTAERYAASTAEALTRMDWPG